VRDPVPFGDGRQATPDDRPRLALVAGDAELVVCIRAGDHAAFETVFRSYYAPMCEFADRYLQSADAAQEIVQDVLCALWADRARLVVTTTLERYLHGAVRNKALNRLRHALVEERAAVMLAVPVDEAPAESGLDEAGEGDERATRLARAIAQLPARRRAVLLLRWQRGLSYQEIASVTGSTVKAVELQLYRTLRTLRQLVAAPTE
jgi:RNA polymerase sigma-70 factor (ECF subfamily)